MMSRVFTDQLGREIIVSFPPKRIVSLVPSQTELLFDLGLDDSIVGLTKFCIHPGDKVREKVKIGGTKKLDLSRIRKLSPDLMIGNKEENDQAQIEELMGEFPVWLSDIYTLTDALEMIAQLGEITNSSSQAEQICKQIEKGFSVLPNETQNKTALYFIWKDPWMLAGGNTFIDDMLGRAGLVNLAPAERYPQISIDQIQELKPDVILLSSEPFPFKDIHVRHLGKVCPSAEITIVDGELFSWYGSRLIQTPSYLRQLISDLI